PLPGAAAPRGARLPWSPSGRRSAWLARLEKRVARLADEGGAAIDEAGVDLHERRARGELRARAGRVEDAAHADEGHAARQRAGEPFEHGVGERQERPAAQAPGLAAVAVRGDRI